MLIGVVVVVVLTLTHNSMQSVVAGQAPKNSGVEEIPHPPQELTSFIHSFIHAFISPNPYPSCAICLHR